MTAIGGIAAIIVWLTLCCALLALAYRQSVAAAWREPVLRVPVLILESDDWGYGPLKQAEALDKLADALGAFQDAYGRHPVMTLGVVLAGPDTDRMRAEGWSTYHRLPLDDARLKPVRDAISRGMARGVFAPQLHGMEHFWPACLMRRAAIDEQVRRWLASAVLPSTEDLPAPLQSRWVDASELPSKPLPTSEAVAAAGQEMAAFNAHFGSVAQVVVPATFVWSDAVEAAWTGAGAQVVVTPGVRNEGRDEAGRVVAGERRYFNAATGPSGVTYVVRDSYLEPSLGHSHLRTIAELREKTRVGRPTLVEIHRFNFVGEERAMRQALGEVRQLLETACATLPDLRFMSTAELARHCRERSALVERRTPARIHFLIRRLAGISRLRKLAWGTGVALAAGVAYACTRPLRSGR